MNKTKLLHIFKPGTWVSTSGEEITFSQADLEATAKAYSPTVHKAPFVIGHPKTDDPAQGWAKSLSVSDAGLYAEPMQVDTQFAESVNAGRYGTISSKFYRPEDPNNPVPGVWYLRHVGFLGAQPPAIKGMEEPSFAEEDGCVCFQEGVEFGGWGLYSTASIFRRLRDWLIGQHGQELAEKIIPNWEIDSLREEANRGHAEADRSSFAETHDQETTVTPAEKAAMEAENQRLKDELRAVKNAQRTTDNVAFAEGLVADARIREADSGLVVAMLTTLGGETPVEFGEGDKKKPLADAMKDFLKALPPSVEFGEHASKDKAATGKGGKQPGAEFAEVETDPDRLSLHVRAEQLAAEKKISYEQAVRSLL